MSTLPNILNRFGEHWVGQSLWAIRKSLVTSYGDPHPSLCESDHRDHYISLRSYSMPFTEKAMPYGNPGRDIVPSLKILYTLGIIY